MKYICDITNTALETIYRTEKNDSLMLHDIHSVAQTIYHTKQQNRIIFNEE